MTALFAKPSKPKYIPPPVKEPPPVPQIGPSTYDTAFTAAKRRSGFRKTILTGALEPAGAGKAVLG